MFRSSEQNVPEITTFLADVSWVKVTRNKYILILAISGLAIVLLSVMFQNSTVAIIRGLIFLIAGIVVYFKPEITFSIQIQFLQNGKIKITKGLLTTVTENTFSGSNCLVKKGGNWLIGRKNVKVPIDAFPNLENEIKAFTL